MNVLLRQIIEQSDALALQAKVTGLKRMALEEFRKLDNFGQASCLNALEVGEVPGTPDFVWTCIVHAGLGELALMDFNEAIGNAQAIANHFDEDTQRTETTPPQRQMNKADRIGADRMAAAIFRLVDRGIINPRSEAADAALDYCRVGCHGGPASVPQWLTETSVPTF